MKSHLFWVLILCLVAGWGYGQPFTMSDILKWSIMRRMDVQRMLDEVAGDWSEALAAETNRAQVAEGAMGEAIVIETNRARVAEGLMGEAIVAETNRAQIIEHTLNAAIVAETNRARVAEGLLGEALAAETNRAQVAEGLLRDGVTNATAVASRVLHVDNGRPAPVAPDGTTERPYPTIQAALDAIGSAAGAAEYADRERLYYRVIVAPGIYTGDVAVPYRPYIALDLGPAVIVGDVVWEVPRWVRYGQTNATLVIRGADIRPAYPDSTHLVVGIAGSLVIRAAADTTPQSIAFANVQLIGVGVSGSVRYETAAGGQAANLSGHLFLDGAQCGAIVATNGWESVCLHARGWSMGHTGFSPALAGSGIGPLVGRVVPYTLESTLVSGGMDLLPPRITWDATRACLWNNVVFETGGGICVTQAEYSVRLDTASYRSWAAATAGAPEGRGGWALGGRMELADAALAVVFPGGDFLTGNGSNLFYVTADGSVTNALTAN